MASAPRNRPLGSPPPPRRLAAHVRRTWRALAADGAVYAREMRRFSRNARLLLLSTLLGAFSAGVFRVAYNLYVLELGFTAADAGRLVTSASLAAGLAAIPAGLLALRVGAKPVILGGAVLLGVGTALQVTPFGYGYLVAGAALGGLGGALWNVVIAPLYAGSADDEGRSYLFTVAAIVFLGMSFAGNAVGGWAPRALADATGWPVWLGFFAVLSAAALYGGLGFFPLLALRAPAARIDRSAFGALRGQVNAIARLLIVHVVIAVGAGLTIPFLNVYFTRQLGLTEAQFGLLAGAGLMTRLGASVFGPIAARRLGKVTAIVVAQSASIPLLLAMGLLPWPLGSSLAFLARGALMNMTAPVRGALYMERVTEAARPATNACLLLAWNLAWAGAAAIGGVLAEQRALAVAVMVTAACYALANGLMWLLWRRRAGPE